MQNIVTPHWLKDNLHHPNLVLLDCSLNIIPETHKTIPNALYFDLKRKFSDISSAYPNMMPSEQQFESKCRALGINQSSEIVVFDHKGIYSSPRVWWMFKTMGHEDVAVLDGGLPEWVDKGYPIEAIKTHYKKGDFKATISSNNVKSFDDVIKNIDESSFLVVDARSEGRFKGTAPEPRKTLKSGHIKNSKNIPFTSVLDQGKFKSPAELQRIFQNLNSDKDYVFSCGSGITACILSLASELAGKPSRTIYDGSWTEWAERNKLLLDKGTTHL